MTSSATNETMRRNLEALQFAGAGCIGWLQSDTARSEVLYHSSPKDTGWRVLLKDGPAPCAMLDSGGDDWLHEQLVALPSEGVVILAGIASGDWATKILKSINSPVVALETYPEIARQALSRNDLSNALRTGKLSLVPIYGDTLDQELAQAHQVLSAHRNLKPRYLLPSSQWWKQALEGTIHPVTCYTGLQVVLGALFPEINGTITRARQLARQWQRVTNGWDRPTLSVFGNASTTTAALKTIGASLFDGFSELGHSASFLEEDPAPDVHSARISAVLESAPDLNIKLADWKSGGLGWLEQVLHVPAVLYATDAPWYLLTPGEPVPPQTLVVTPERNYGEWLQQHFDLPWHHLPLFASYPHSPVPEAEQLHEICFIGSINDDGNWLSGLPLHSRKQAIELLWQARDQHANGDPDTLIRELAKLDGWRHPPVLPHLIWGTLYRLAALLELNGLPLSIYGSNAWKQVLADTPLAQCYKGWLEPKQQLPATMARATINLNLTSLPNWHSGNMRTYDAAGLGTCVLHDRKPDVMTQFVDGQSMAFFAGRSDLRKVAESMLSDPARALSIGAQALRVIDSSHRPVHRAKRILELLQLYGPDWRSAGKPSAFKALLGR